MSRSPGAGLNCLLGQLLGIRTGWLQTLDKVEMLEYFWRNFEEMGRLAELGMLEGIYYVKPETPPLTYVS